MDALNAVEASNSTMNNFKQTSKFISLILRHKPEIIGITLDVHLSANGVWLTKEVPAKYLRKQFHD